jgi:hypothetical protein
MPYTKSLKKYSNKNYRSVAENSYDTGEHSVKKPLLGRNIGRGVKIREE